MEQARMSSDVTWQLGPSSATLECGPLVGEASFGSTGIGFHVTEWKQQREDKTALFASDVTNDYRVKTALVESYSRGGDLVASFAKSETSIIPQVCYRASCDLFRSVIRLELILSVQTDLLDSRPECGLGSYLWDGQLFHTSELQSDTFEEVPKGDGVPFDRADSLTHLFLTRVRRHNFSYAELVHPSDFVRAKAGVDDTPLVAVEYTLFPDRLEKGVIRRARICGWFLPAENDLAVAVELAKQFINEPLPLTA
jgi:hypothetical protein